MRKEPIETEYNEIESIGVVKTLIYECSDERFHLLDGFIAPTVLATVEAIFETDINLSKITDSDLANSLVEETSFEIAFKGVITFQLRNKNDLFNPNGRANGGFSFEGYIKNGWPTLLFGGENGFSFTPGGPISVDQPCDLILVSNILRHCLVPFWIKIHDDPFDKEIEMKINNQGTELINLVLDTFEEYKNE